jgi:hypothetical protein
MLPLIQLLYNHVRILLSSFGTKSMFLFDADDFAFIHELPLRVDYPRGMAIQGSRAWVTCGHVVVYELEVAPRMDWKRLLLLGTDIDYIRYNVNYTDIAFLDSTRLVPADPFKPAVHVIYEAAEFSLILDLTSGYGHQFLSIQT